MGGGLLTAVDENLSPVLVSVGTEETEILLVQVSVCGMNIRIFNAYGPQEGSSKNSVLNFWHEVEKQIILAKDEECGIIMEFDANGKLGKGVIKNDPNGMPYNGKILFDMIKRKNLTIGNASNLCNGTLTRHRSTLERDEMAVLDYV